MTQLGVLQLPSTPSAKVSKSGQRDNDDNDDPKPGRHRDPFVRGVPTLRRAGRRTGAAVLLVAAAGVAAFIGFGGIGAGGAGTAATAHAPDAPGATAGTRSALPLGALPGSTMYVPRSGIAFDPRLPNTVYIATTSWNRQGVSRGHVYKTIDGGQHWRGTATTDAGWTRIDALTADPRQSGTLYADTNVVSTRR